MTHATAIPFLRSIIDLAHCIAIIKLIATLLRASLRCTLSSSNLWVVLLYSVACLLKNACQQELYPRLVYCTNSIMSQVYRSRVRASTSVLKASIIVGSPGYLKTVNCCSTSYSMIFQDYPPSKHLRMMLCMYICSHSHMPKYVREIVPFCNCAASHSKRNTVYLRKLAQQSLH